MQGHRAHERVAVYRGADPRGSPLPMSCCAHGTSAARVRDRQSLWEESFTHRQTPWASDGSWRPSIFRSPLGQQWWQSILPCGVRNCISRYQGPTRAFTPPPRKPRRHPIRIPTKSCWAFRACRESSTRRFYDYPLSSMADPSNPRPTVHSRHGGELCAGALHRSPGLFV